MPNPFPAAVPNIRRLRRPLSVHPLPCCCTKFTTILVPNLLHTHTHTGQEGESTPRERVNANAERLGTTRRPSKSRDSSPKNKKGYAANNIAIRSPKYSIDLGAYMPPLSGSSRSRSPGGGRHALAGRVLTADMVEELARDVVERATAGQVCVVN